MTTLDNSDLLGPQSSLPQIGEERLFVTAGESIGYKSRVGRSCRFVHFRDGTPVSALQVVQTGVSAAIVAQVFTVAKYRRLGLATKLLNLARRYFDPVLPARHLSDDGRAWTRANWPEAWIDEEEPHAS